ncbi:hypothetical protein HZA40_04465 [Candidatus Peregrinibacteria bacterium]|nr:hypothetical protein [Candidatus Peregrinibacteria bacterium]
MTPETKPEKKPEAPQGVTPKEGPAVSSAAGAERGKLGDKTAKDVAPDASKEKKNEGEEEMPDNKWSQAYHDLEAQLKANPGMQGPLSTFALAMLRLAAKYSNYVDLMPGRFETTITTSEEYKDKSLDGKQLDAVLKGDKAKAEVDTLKDLKEKAEKEKTAGHKLGRERASTKFVTNVLWGFDDIEDTTTLAASLIHTTKSDVALYEVSTLDKIKSGSPKKGTLIVFVPDLSKGEKVVAYATGVADEFKYFDIEDATKPVHTFKLSDADCPVKKMIGLMTVLVPNIDNFKAAPDEKAEGEAKPADAPEAAKLTPVESVKKSFEDIEAKNRGMSDLIALYEKNPIPLDVTKIKTEASNNVKFIEETMAGLKIQVDSLNIDELKKAEVAAEQKSRAPAATDADKSAYVDAKNKREEAEMIKEYWAKFGPLLTAAKKNKTDADALK